MVALFVFVVHSFELLFWREIVEKVQTSSNGEGWHLSQSFEVVLRLCAVGITCRRVLCGDYSYTEPESYIPLD